MQKFPNFGDHHKVYATVPRTEYVIRLGSVGAPPRFESQWPVVLSRPPRKVDHLALLFLTETSAARCLFRLRSAETLDSFYAGKTLPLGMKDCLELETIFQPQYWINYLVL